MQSIPRLEYAGKTRWSEGGGSALPWEGQGEDDRQGRLHGEVDGKDGLLKGRKLWARQGTICHNATDEGLEDLGAEESSIAGRSLISN